MRRLITISCLILLSCFSCKHDNKKDILLSSFNKSYKLSDSRIVIDSLIYPRNLCITNDLILFKDLYNGKHIQMYKKDGQYLQSFLYNGRGPNETANVLKMNTYEDSILQVSIENEGIFVYNLNNVRKNVIEPVFKYFLPQSTPAFVGMAKYNSEELCFIGKDTNSLGNETRFCIYNTNLHKITNVFGKYPEDDILVPKYPTNDFSKLTAYQGTIILKPDYSKALVYYHYAVGFDILDLNNYTVEKSKYYQYPIVDIINFPELNVNVIKKDSTSLRGFQYAWCDNDNFYLLYPNKCFSEPSGGSLLLKYNWDGEPICLYDLNRNVKSFAIDNKEKKIYVIIDDDEYSRIICYNLPL